MDQMQALSQISRPELGQTIPVSVFRIFRQFSAQYSSDILGDKGAQTVFVHAGRMLGSDIGQRIYSDDLNEYLSNATQYIYDAKVGILSLVETDPDKMVFQLDECVTCAGMPNLGMKICGFEVGLVAGVVETYLEKSVGATETKCNANGDECCEVTLRLNPLNDYFKENYNEPAFVGAEAAALST